jgi:hypothetical protein
MVSLNKSIRGVNVSGKVAIKSVISLLVLRWIYVTARTIHRPKTLCHTQHKFSYFVLLSSDNSSPLNLYEMGCFTNGCRKKSGTQFHYIISALLLLLLLLLLTTTCYYYCYYYYYRPLLLPLLLPLLSLLLLPLTPTTTLTPILLLLLPPPPLLLLLSSSHIHIQVLQFSCAQGFLCCPQFRIQVIRHQECPTVILPPPQHLTLTKVGALAGVFLAGILVGLAASGTSSSGSGGAHS